MPLEETFLAELKCCLHDDGHIVIKPLQLKCGGNACQRCVNDMKRISTKCFECNKEHTKNDLISSAPNKIAQKLIETSVEDIFKYLQKKLQSLKSINKFIVNFDFE